jgi:hypothetical protein
LRLELSSEGRYSLRALLYLAWLGEQASADRISAEANVAGNEKLKGRSPGIVREAAGVTEDEAGELLRAADGCVKVAGVMALAGDRDGNFARSDGWGYILDDDGGGYYMGRRGSPAPYARTMAGEAPEPSCNGRGMSSEGRGLDGAVQFVHQY